MEVPPQPLPSIFAPSTSAPLEPVPEAASSDASPAVPPAPEPPITIPAVEYQDLLTSFHTLTITQMTIMERMDHFQLRQDQQTLILREIQQHLGLLPLAPPVSPVPSEPFASADDFDPADDATPGAYLPQLQLRTPLSTRGAYYLIIRSLLSFFSPLLSGGITSSLLLSLAFEHWGQCSS
ncbi:hypothetical protein CK203_115408 [Vitis vinifera]|uniref:Uncharacterized protein n=1 Tax=Vitis vinifera TaxID=29760 RepID=A0A438BSJ6_VITVI|nr:hypothetical protein CK203_115408 [Vitis vinifera]